MKHLKRINEDFEHKPMLNDMRFVTDKQEIIKTCYDHVIKNFDLPEMFDEEILEWVDDDWEEEYESEYDHYMDFGHGEAEDVIRETIVNSCETDLGIKLNLDESEELCELLNDETGINLNV